MDEQGIDRADIFVVLGILMMLYAAYQLAGVWAVVGLGGFIVVILALAVEWGGDAR